MKSILFTALTQIILIASTYGQNCDFGSTGMIPDEDEMILIWADEFNDGGEVCAENWHFQTRCLPGQLFCWANDELQHYTDRPDNAFVEDGVLKIVAKRENFSDQGLNLQYTSARLNSKFAFTYGRVDVRAKLPAELGTWPAIWMLGKNISEGGAFFAEEFGTTPWPATGEIDIMEQFGRNNVEKTEVHGTTHTPAGFAGSANGGKTSAPTSTTEFHVYSMVWDEDEIQFLLDDVVYYTYNPISIYGVKNNDTWPFDKPQFMLLNIAMGGILGGNVPNDFVSATMEIDYVRVFQSYDEDTSDNLGFPSAIASDPIQNSELVTSLFGDTYNSIEGVNVQFNDAVEVYSDLTNITGNEVIRYIDVNEQIIDFTSSPQSLDGESYLHIDYWTPNSNELTIDLINAENIDASYMHTTSTATWVSLDIPISEFTSAEILNGVSQIKFTGQGVYYLDNIFFYQQPVNLEEQSITFPPISDVSIDQGSFELVATSSSGLEVEFSTFSTELSIEGDIVTLLRPGTVVVTAEQPGNDTYLPAEPVTQVFCVNPSTPIINQIERNDAIILVSSSDEGNRWFLNGDRLFEENGSELIVEEGGIYSLQVAIDGCNSPFSENLPLIITGIENGLNREITIYPNPTSSKLHVQSKETVTEIMLFDSMGRGISVEFIESEDNSISIDLSEMAPGVYFLEIVSDNQNKRARIVRQ